jgi:hypothetical protein
LFTAQVGSGSFPLSCGVFFLPPLSQAFPFLVAGHVPGSRQHLSGPPSLFIYSSGKDSLPPIFCAQCPTFFPTCLYCSYCLVLSFSFFPGCRLVSPGGYAALAQGCLWEYRVPLSSPCLRLPSRLGVGDWRPRGPPGFSV